MTYKYGISMQGLLKVTSHKYQDSAQSSFLLLCAEEEILHKKSV